MRLLLVGPAGSGKDTVADYLVERHGFRKYAFADKLKEIAAEMFPELYESNRRTLLQKLGDAFRNLYPDVGVDHVLKKIAADDPPCAVIGDGRYANEYQKCVGEGFVPLFVTASVQTRQARLRERDGRLLALEEETHPSEKEALTVQALFPGYLIKNDGSYEELCRKVDEFVACLRGAGIAGGAACL
ncbi:hypothetical protein EDD75_0357 [Thermodesulfitimonas autotrophica]|uniref:Dephospho-CoA kinase n=1 Tax=Thermodesulfitimonas autotrophica TaxID=1894989 RepID=A0A3N5B1P5_9THEO|nr:AAA family ATPase [Thermodesulfitimonas autotrophica]RPF49540.1 hypothetical protein EDD75_0357 [Thermodesulfitimonas autotrophica]